MMAAPAQRVLAARTATQALMVKLAHLEQRVLVAMTAMKASREGPAQLVQKEKLASLALLVPPEWLETKVSQVPKALTALKVRLVPAVLRALLETSEMRESLVRTARTVLTADLDRVVGLVTLAEEVPMELKDLEVRKAA